MLRIALSGSITKDDEGYNLAYANNAYVQALTRLEAMPLIVPCISNLPEPKCFQPQKCVDNNLRQYVTAALETVDALLLTGGHDVDPRFYGEEPQSKLGSTLVARDVFDFALLEVALKKQMPVLAICRGLQLINVYFGGSLYQDLNYRSENTLAHTQKSSPDKTYHSVALQANSLLAEICQTDNLFVNSLHHQAIKELAPNLQSLAVAKDGLIEAFNLRNYPFLLAVQWHPEFLESKQAQMRNIFQTFLQAAQSYRETVLHEQLQ